MYVGSFLCMIKAYEVLWKDMGHLRRVVVCVEWVGGL